MHLISYFGIRQQHVKQDVSTRNYQKYTTILNLVDDSAIDKYQEIKEAYDVLRLLPKESDLYKRLGVERTATADEIKSAYRRCAFKLYTFSSLSDWGHETRRYLWHSWQNEEGKEAIERNKEISEAYDILHNPEKRRRYDKYGANADYSDIPPDQNNNLNTNNDIEQLLPLFPFYYRKGQKATVRHYLRLERILDQLSEGCLSNDVCSSFPWKDKSNIGIR